MESVLDLDATALAEKLRNLDVSSLELVNTYISHVEKINCAVNCMVEDRFEQARQEAQRADEKLRDGTASGRLWGVPISIKESFNVAGMKTTAGIPYLSHSKAENDAAAVRRLKAEGAVILGKTNTPVLCFCQETDNKVYGRTNNPWNLSRTAGGSSGGEAAMIAVGGAALGLGSDIGGSIRIPAHFNGVVGFKSGKYQLPAQGHVPLIDHPLQSRMAGLGPLAKSVRDARMVNQILSGIIPEKQDLSNFKVVIPRSSLYYPADVSTRNALVTAAEILEADFEVLDEQPPGYQEATELWQHIMCIGGDKELAEFAFGNRPCRPVREYLKEVIFHSSDLHRYFTRTLIIANLLKPGPKKLKQLEKAIVAGEEKITRYLDKKIIILPVWHSAAPKHGRVAKEIFSIRLSLLRVLPFVCLANTWGLPALAVPVAEDTQGMPIGLQVIGRTGNEEAIFQVGEILEKSMRGYRRASIT